MIAEVQDQHVVALRGDPDHPVTRGFLCYRTSRFPERQRSSERMTRPLLRRGDRQVEIPLAEALDMAAEKLVAIRHESGPGAILHYRGGGSLGLLKTLSDYFFEAFGPVAGKTGDICSGGGDAAQTLDFGYEDSNDLFDLENARHIINWGKNLHVSNLHLVPLLKGLRAKGVDLITIDPVRTRAVEISDRFLAVRPDGDIPFALAVARRLFESGRVDASIRARVDHLDAFRDLAFSRPMSSWLEACDLTAEDVERVAGALLDGPTAILVGWGLQRRSLGASTVRVLDALSVLSGNLGRKGGGVSFYYKRRGAFDTSFMKQLPPPRTFSEPTLGAELLAARPPVRAIWVTAGNPVAMLPDSRAVAKAIEATEFSVVVDAFATDTTRRATLVLPTTTLLEDDDLLGAYGHHYIGVSRPVVRPPDGVLTDLELMQAIAERVGLADVLRGTAREWKTRMLARAAGQGVTLEALERGPMRNPFSPKVLFEDGRVMTETGRVSLIGALPPVLNADPESEYPLHLFSSSTEKSQSSQWATEMPYPLPAMLHPDAARGLADGAVAKLISPIGELVVRLKHDASQRRDLVVVPKGGHLDRGSAANAIIVARATDHGEGAAYLSTRVRVEPHTLET